MAAIVARAYQHSFDVRPNSTLALTNATLFALGDAVAQASTIVAARPGPHDDPPVYDVKRTLRFFTFGFAMGPLLGKWNMFLERRFPIRAAPGARVRPTAVAKRVAADQLIMAPTGLALFLGAMGFMEGRDTQQIQRKYQDIYVPALLANWQVWPLAQVINFRYMPLSYRIPFQSTLGIFWNLYLSLLNSRDNVTQEKLEKIEKTTG